MRAKNAIEVNSDSELRKIWQFSRTRHFVSLIMATSSAWMDGWMVGFLDIIKARRRSGGKE